ncbi:MAG: selenocysteine-specific translation elongation factor [Planctomycetota bacterium]|nr:MAG: selenocysteine-specific translation elongation factor [Planctomycetota bacterium]
MPEELSIHPIIVGTAGHVDHGKSSLVRRLTGIDPDRWEEEKARGLTIDLGFARFPLPDGRIVGLLDVPGHERFLKNMVAGATSIDLALLVVAADDGVMPQTREHLDVLELLGVQRGLVALTKIDIVDEETRELAEEDVRELLQGRVLEGAPILPVSSETGQGYDELERRLQELASQLEPRSDDGIFRMPVQRVFTVPGFGTVLTGIPLAGNIRVGERLALAGKGLESRVRSLQAYASQVEEARAGHSTAICVPDIPVDRAERGDVLVVPGTIEPNDRFELEVKIVQDVLPLRHAEELHLHVGTRELVARCYLLDREELPAGERGLVQVVARESTVALAGDHVLLRRLSPARTIAGGRVIGVGGRKLRRFKEDTIERLAQKGEALSDPVACVRLALVEGGEKGVSRDELAARLGRTAQECAPWVQEVLHQGMAFAEERSGRLFAAESLRREEERFERILAGWFRKHPLSMTCPTVRFRRDTAEGLQRVLLQKLVQEGRIEVLSGGQLRDLQRRDPLSPEERQRLEGLGDWLEEAGARPRSRDEIASHLGKQHQTFLNRLIESDAAVAVGPSFVWGRKSFDAAIEHVEQLCGEPGGVLDIPKLRDRLDTSRKFLIPFLEHLDRTGVTARKGDRRILRRR